MMYQFRAYKGHKKRVFDRTVGINWEVLPGWTWECTCGATDSANTKAEANQKFADHKNAIANLMEK